MANLRDQKGKDILAKKYAHRQKSNGGGKQTKEGSKAKA